MHSLNYRAKAAGAALALGLVASACGSDATSQTTAAESDGDVSQSTAASSESTEPGSQGESTADVEGPVADGAQEAGPAEEETAAPAGHLFPDLPTVNITEGTTLNLADELAGGDTPILLWFWAPH